MLVPISWLKEIVEIDLDTDALAERITLAGLEVAAIHQVGDWWDPDTIVVGQVVAVRPHPDADRLVLVDVDFGGEPQQVVTGAPNLFQYRHSDELPVLKVAFALAGATLVDAYSEERPRPMKKLKPTKIRGVRSAGMVCSERELGLSEEHEGILLLPEDAPLGVPLRQYLGDQVLELDLTPDMARCLSITGVAREVAALTEARLHLPPNEWQPGGDDNVDDYVTVAVADPDLCQRYTGIVIRDVRVEPSPPWMQDRLRRAGMRPINNIVDVTNYVMLELGQPLHAFDYDLLVERARRAGGGTPAIVVRTPRPGETITTLDDVERALDESVLLIADAAGPIAIAGVMGGRDTEVHSATRNVLLESATFEGINNRRTAQALKLHTEASHRFTRGVPATLNARAGRRAAEFLRRYAGGRIVPGIADAYPVRQVQPVVYVTESEVGRQLGMEVSLTDIAGALRRLDFQVQELATLPDDPPEDAVFGLHVTPSEPVLECTAPWHRLDIRIPADLTEEVARVVGYDQVGTTLLDDVLPPQRTNLNLQTEERIRDLLVAAGLQETISNALTTPEAHDRLHPAASGAGERRAPFIELANPLSAERRVMRRTLLVSLLENWAYNSRFTDRFAVFELGMVFLPELGGDTYPREEWRLGILLTGSRLPVTYQTRPGDREDFDFFDLKGIVEMLVRRLDFDAGHLVFSARPDTGTFGPRCAEVTLRNPASRGGRSSLPVASTSSRPAEKDQPLGLLGELHPRVRSAFGLPEERICIAELSVAPLVRPAWALDAMAAISIYPPVVEDLAFVVDEEIPARQVLDAIRQGGDGAVVDVVLFDVYRGQSIPAGQKSLAYRITYQSPDHSLEEEEISRIRRCIVEAVEADASGRLRDR